MADDIKELVKRMTTGELMDAYISAGSRSDDSDDADGELVESRAFLAGVAAGEKLATERMGGHSQKKRKRADGDDGGGGGKPFGNDDSDDDDPDDDDMDDDDKDRKSKRMSDDEMTEKAAALADERADLLHLVRDLLPSEFTARGKTNVEILVAAVGDEVKDADKRSSDYLLAKVESIVERRASASQGRENRGGEGGKPAVRADATIDVTRHLKRD